MVQPSGDPHAPLRADVSLLGRLLGRTLVEQAGQATFDTVESVRALAKRGRARDPEAQSELKQRLADLPVDEAVPVARAFAQFLTLANIAEQHHRERRRRDHQRDPKSPPQRGSLADAVLRLKEAGCSVDEIHATVARMQVELVLTAHPTEVTRRTLLAKHQRIAALLARHGRPDLTPQERTRTLEALHAEVEAVWATPELRTVRPSPEDEAKGGFAVVERMLWDVVPQHLRALDDTLRAHTGRGLPLDAAPIVFGSWMGGDRDGNPNVTPETTRRVVWLARWMAADLWHREVDALRQELSMTAADDAVRAMAGDAPTPYRAVLRDLRDRLAGTKRRIEARLDGDPLPDVAAFEDDTELGEILWKLYRSLHSVGAHRVADERLLDLLRRFRCFGMHLVRLDLRQEADRHTAALAAVTRHLGLGDYAQWDEDQRTRFLKEELAANRPLIPRDLPADAAVEDVLKTLQVAAGLPRASLGAYVISMAARPSDVLAVMLLQREAGLTPPLPVVPLFETLADLERADAVLEGLLSLPVYRAAVGDDVQVMIGYSDSSKDAGLLAAAWALYRAQERLVAVAARHRVRLTLFHGRGGSVGRGGGPAHAGIVSLPPGAVDGRLRVTEQGEVIFARFGLPGVALRTLELYTAGVLESTMTPPPAPRDEWRRAMDDMAATARDAYRDVLQRDGFVAWFRAATPEAELGDLKIGSRPARRRAEGGLESLRAIPWQFAWTQNRLMLPAWLGVGTALTKAYAAGNDTLLMEMRRGWPFWRTTLDLVEMVAAKADPWVSAQYDDALVPEDLRALGTEMRDRLQATIKAVERALGHVRLLEENPVLARSIAVRNPYVDPLNLLQVEFLRRVRQGEDPRIRQALSITLNGVAQGMRNTG